MNNGIQPTVELATNNGSYPYPVMYGNGGGFGNEARRRDAYEELGECLVKLIKKAK